MILFFFQAVTIATDYGDMKIELFCEDTPKTCEVCPIKFRILSLLQHHPSSFL